MRLWKPKQRLNSGSKKLRDPVILKPTQIIQLKLFFYFPRMLSTELQTKNVELWHIRRFACKLNQTQYKERF